MNLLKSVLSTVVFVYGSVSLVFAKQQLTDSTAVKNSSDSLSAGKPADPKEGFKNLFSTAPSISTKVTTTAYTLNPMAISFVEDYVSRMGSQLVSLKSSGKPFFDLIDNVMLGYNLPRELKYLAVIESQLKNNAVSWAGAVGPWQFMPETARRYGLQVNQYYDERRDFVRSTQAAARYLNTLYNMYGDWLLVIAAYNGGPGNVNSAIRRSGSTDFWKLQYFLPTESRNHVKKFIATHYIMEGSAGITTITKNERNRIQESKIIADTATSTTIKDEDGTLLASVKVNGRYNSLVISKYLEMEVNKFNKYNPDFDKTISSIGSYTMKLPTGKMDVFSQKKIEILYESIQLLLNNVSNSVTKN